MPKLAEKGYRVIGVEPIANELGGNGAVGAADYDADVERKSLRPTVERATSGERVHLVGWSNGGRAALAYAAGYPQHVASVTAVEPAAWWLLPDDAGAAELATLADALHGREVTEDELVTFLSNVVVAPPGTDYRALPQWSAWSSVRNTLSWYGPRMTSSAAAQLAAIDRIEVPTLLLRGTWTAGWLRRVVDRLAEQLPKVVVRDLEGGHACLLQSQDAFVDAVDAHVRSVTSTA